jgi:WD40 repeat protein
MEFPFRALQQPPKLHGLRLWRGVNGDRRRAGSNSNDQTVKVWDLETGALIATFACNAGASSCVLIGDNDDRVHWGFLRSEGEVPCRCSDQQGVPQTGFSSPREADSSRDAGAKMASVKWP